MDGTVITYLLTPLRNQLITYSHVAQESMEGWISRLDVTFSSSSDALASLAVLIGDEWPFVTVPDFDTLTAKPLLNQPGCEEVFLAPKVTENQFEDYSLYTNSYVPRTDRSVHWPVSQVSPPPEEDSNSMVNVDLFAKDDEPRTEMAVSFYSGLANEIPVSYFLHPVHTNSGNMASAVVAVLAGRIDWVDVIIKVLPRTETSVVVVLQDSCRNSSWTFSSIDGDFVLCDECEDSLENGIDIHWLDGFQIDTGGCGYNLVSTLWNAMMGLTV